MAKKDIDKEIQQAKEKLILSQQNAAATEKELQKKKELLKVQEKETDDAKVVLAINKENLKIVSDLKQKKLELAIIGRDLSDEEKKRLDITQKVLLANARDAKDSQIIIDLLEQLNKEKEEAKKNDEKAKEDREASIKDYKEIIKQKKDLSDLEKEAVQDIGDYNSELVSVANSLGKNNKLYKAIQSRQESIKTTVQSVSGIIQSLPDSQKQLTGAAQNALKVYKDSESSVARALNDLGNQKITQEEYNSIAEKTNKSLQEALTYIDRSTKEGEVLYNTLKNAGGAGKEFTTSVKESEKSFSALSAGFANFNGIPVMGEMGALLKTNIKDTLAFKAAVFALGAALGKAAFDYFGAPIKIAQKAQYEIAKNQIETAQEVRKIDVESAYIPQKINMAINKNRIDTADAVNRAMIEASFAQAKAANQFNASLKSAAAQFAAASKTALFGKGIGSVGYATAQMQLAGIGAEKVAAAMEAAGAATGKMPSAKVGADMAIMAERTGQSVDNIAQINEYFQRTDKVSGAVAINMQEGMRAMADQAGIGLGNLMKEVAEASKDALSYQIKSGPALAKAVAYTQSMGLNFGDVAKAGKNMVLNYKDSIKAEMQLSSLLGEQVDLSEVRAKFAAGDQKGALDALKAQGLDPADMDMFQQDALSQALGGMDLQSISKVANNTGKDPGDLKQGSAKAGNETFLGEKTKAEQTLQAKQAKISADQAVIDAALAGKIQEAYLKSPGYLKYQQEQANLAKQEAELAGQIERSKIGDQKLQKLQADMAKLDFVQNIKENLMEGFAMLAGGLATSVIGSVFGGIFGGKKDKAPKEKGKGGVLKSITGLITKPFKAIGGFFKKKKGEDIPGGKSIGATDKKPGIFGKVAAFFGKKSKDTAPTETQLATGSLFSKSNPGYVVMLGGDPQKSEVSVDVKTETTGAEPAGGESVGAPDKKGLVGKIKDKFASIKEKAKAKVDAIKSSITDKISGIKDKAKEKVSKIKDNLKGKVGKVKDNIKGKFKKLIPKKFAGITSMFGGGGKDEEAGGGEAQTNAAESVSKLADASPEADKAGGAIETIGKAGGGMEGVLKGLAMGLKAFADPIVVLGAVGLAAAIVVIGAGIAGAAWILGKALPSLAEGLKAFNTVDGKNLALVGLGLVGLGAGMVAMGAGAVIGGIGNLVGGLFGGGIEDTIKKIKIFSDAKIDVAKVKNNADAVVAYSKAMMMMGAGSAASGLGTLVEGLAGGIGKFFGAKPPLDKMKEFAQADLGDTAKLKANAEAFTLFGDAMSSYKGGGGMGDVLAAGVAKFFGVSQKLPIDQFKEFAAADFGDLTNLKNNAEAYTLFGNAMSSYKGSSGGVGEVLAQAVSGYFKVETPIDKFKAFAAISGIDVNQVKNNADAFVLFGNAMASYTGAGGTGFWSSLGEGIASFFGAGKKDLIGDFQRFSKIDASGLKGVSEGVGAMSNSLQNFPSDKVSAAGAALEEFADYLDDGEAETLKVVGPAIASLGTGLAALSGIQNNPNIATMGASLKAVVDSKVFQTIATQAPFINLFAGSLNTLNASLSTGIVANLNSLLLAAVPLLAFKTALETLTTSKVIDTLGVQNASLTSFANTLTALNTAFASGTTANFMLISGMSSGIDMTTTAILKLNTALTELAQINLTSLRGIPWDQMTNFGRVPGGSVVLAKNANNNFTIEKNTAKNIELQLQKITDFATTTKQLLEVNKNLQLLIEAQVTGQEGKIQLMIDGRPVSRMIKKRADDNKGNAAGGNP